MSCLNHLPPTINPVEALTLLQSWAAATTDAWASEVQLEVRRQKRTETSLRFRARKKQELTQLRKERDRLEEEVKKRLGKLNCSIAVRDLSTSSTLSIKVEIGQSVCELALESDALRTENQQLQQKLQTQERFLSLATEAVQIVNPFSSVDTNSQNVYEASKTSPWVAASHRNESGWRVNFPNGEPSFYFEPFTRAEIDEELRVCDEMLSISLPCSSIVGNLFGWTVYHAPVVRRLEDNSLFAHARFTMRAYCNLEEADAFMNSVSINRVTVLVIPTHGRGFQRDLVNMQVLQEFDKDHFAMVCNIPGQPHTRYLQLAQRLPKTEANGKRSITYAVVVADSEANARNREAEQPQSDVKWVRGGGLRMKLTQVDDTTIDVSADYWAPCENRPQTQRYFVMWAEYACQWSRLVVPSRLLTSTRM